MDARRFAPLSEGDARSLLQAIEAEEDWRLSLPYMADDERAGALVLFGLAKELADTPARVSEPPLAAIRFQWWRDAIDEAFGEAPVRRHPLALAIEATLGGSSRMRPHLDALIDGAETAVGLLPPGKAREAVAVAQPLYGRLGTALTVWLSGNDTRATPIAHALSLHAAARAAASRPAGRGLPRIADRIAEFGAADALSPMIRGQAAALRRLPSELVPAALPFLFASDYARGRQPSSLAKKARCFKTVLTGRF